MRVKILSVDDSRTIRLIVAHAFRSYDCQVSEAANGREGLAAAAREKPDLICLDLVMPVMDGVAMLTKLREDPELKAIPVIMLTSEADPESVQFITRLGVSGYLVKPFSEEVLVEIAAGVVRLQKRPASETAACNP